MGKKKNKEFPQVKNTWSPLDIGSEAVPQEKRNQLTPAEYWEWIATIEQRTVAQEKLKIENLKLEMFALHADNLNLKNHIQKTHVTNAVTELAKHEEEYDRFISKLEETLGVPVKGKVIDSIDFKLIDENI